MDYTSNELFDQSEEALSSSDTCPDMNALYGTTGSAGSYNNNTRAYVMKRGGAWYFMQPAYFSISPHVDSPYSTTVWDDYDVFRASDP